MSRTQDEFSKIPNRKRTTYGGKRDRYSDIGSTSGMRSKRAKRSSESAFSEYETKSGNNINASKVIKRAQEVDGKMKKFSLIATQCPLPSTLETFWDLIMTSKADAIVALGPVQPGRLDNYWSEGRKGYDPGTYNKIFCDKEKSWEGCYTIETKSESVVHSAHKRILEITDCELEYTNDWNKSISGKIYHPKKTKKIPHYHYSEWPDRSLPKNLDDFEKFVYEFKDCRKLVVHCSAGVGRTGTFAACLDALKHGITNPKAIVTEMRRYRTLMVQTAVQFDMVCKFIARNCLDLKKLGLPKPNWTDEIDYDAYFPEL